MSEFDISILNLLSEFKIDKRLITRIINNIFVDHNFKKANINVVLTDDNDIIGLNKQYLGIDTTTDVLSFVIEMNKEKNILEGEVYASLQQIERQARDYNINFENELLRIVIHGILHLVGYDDQLIKEKQQMTEKENYYLELV